MSNFPTLPEGPCPGQTMPQGDCPDPGIETRGEYAPVYGPDMCAKRLVPWRGVDAAGRRVFGATEPTKAAYYTQGKGGTVGWSEQPGVVFPEVQAGALDTTGQPRYVDALVSRIGEFEHDFVPGRSGVLYAEPGKGITVADARPASDGNEGDLLLYRQGCLEGELDTEKRATTLPEISDCAPSDEGTPGILTVIDSQECCNGGEQSKKAWRKGTTVIVPQGGVSEALDTETNFLPLFRLVTKNDGGQVLVMDRDACPWPPIPRYTLADFNAGTIPSGLAVGDCKTGCSISTDSTGNLVWTCDASTVSAGGKPIVQVYSYSGSIQTIVVPDGCTELEMQLWGGAGASDYRGSIGGPGGFTKAVLPVNGGDEFSLLVGQGGRIAGQGQAFGFGGLGGTNGVDINYGGGGLTGLFTGTTAITAADFARAIAIAGGGGAAAANLRTASTSDGHGGPGNAGAAGGQADMQGIDAPVPPDQRGGGGGGYRGGGQYTIDSWTPGLGGTSFTAGTTGDTETLSSVLGTTAPPRADSQYYLAGAGASSVPTTTPTAGGNGLAVILFR